jgi:hypothetical protein
MAGNRTSGARNEMLDDPAILETLARELMARADMLRAATPTEDKASEPVTDGWITEAQAARLIGDRSADRLRKHRDRQTGPAHEHLRRGYVRYRRAEVLKWAARNPRRPANPDKSGHHYIDDEDDAA